MPRMTTAEQHQQELAEAVYAADATWYAAIDSVEAQAAYKAALKSFRDWERKALDGNAAVSCRRCGGEGGWKGWPGFTCFRCGGSGLESLTKTRFPAQPPTRAKREAKANAEVAASDAAYAEAIGALGEVGVALDAARQEDVGGMRGVSRETAFRASLASKLYRFGSLSEAQVAAVERGLEREREVEAKHEAAGPLTAGKQEISGTIVSHKWVEKDSYVGYGTTSTHKMLVELDNGNRVFGTMPAAVDEACWLDEECTQYEPKGVRVKFTAEVEPSRDDPFFGFYKLHGKTKAEAFRPEQ